MRKRRDDLLLEKLRKKGKDDLFDQIDRAGKEFDNMSDELQHQIDELTGGDLDSVVNKVNQAIRDRQDALDKQIDELDKLRGFK